MRLFFLILVALGVGAALGHYGPGLVRGSDQTEFTFAAPDPDPKYVKSPKPGESYACDPLAGGNVLLTVASGAAAYGEAAGYKCNIKHSLQLGKDGSAEPRALGDLKIEFVIDRASGRMLGGTASAVWRYEVLDRGSDKQSSKVLYTSHAGFLHIQLLQIEEFQDGPVKPFLIVDSTEVHNLHPSPVAPLVVLMPPIHW